MKRMLLLMLCALLLTACTALPAEERSFAVVLGVDRQGETWKVFARTPTYQTGGGYTTLQGEGDTLESALSAMDAAAPMQLHFGQLRLLVFSADFARTEAFPAALSALANRHDLRLGASVGIAETDMKELMDAMKPATGSRLSKSIDVLMETRIEQGTVLPAVLTDVIRMGERQSPVLMNISLEGQEISVSGAWPAGMKGSVTEAISAGETQLLSLMLGQMDAGTLTLTEGMVQLLDVKVKTELTLPAMQSASVRLELRVGVSSMSEEALPRAVASACLGMLNRLSAMGCDALGLASQAIFHAEDMNAWHEMDWPARYRELDWSVSVGIEGKTGKNMQRPDEMCPASECVQGNGACQRSCALSRQCPHASVSRSSDQAAFAGLVEGAVIASIPVMG